MKKGDIAVPYVVAIILGIIVLVIIVYIIYRYVLHSPLSCHECTAKLTTWCSKCYIVNYNRASWTESGSGMDDELKECVVMCELSTAMDDCIGAEDDCLIVGIPPV